MSDTTLDTQKKTIPAEGRSREEVVRDLLDFKANDLADYSKVYGYTYNPGGETEDLAKEAFVMYLTENALDITSYPSVMNLENEVVGIVLDLLRGSDEACGNMTSGGTESILLAMKTARDYFRVHKPEITEPEMILPRTAHPAFHKACHYFNIKPVITGFDSETFRADVQSMRDAITPNTIILVGSACSFAHGVIDPIEDIAALAKEHGLLCHVDGCVGGIHFSLMRRMGYELPAFDFSVDGVTSISADMHKYGFAPKNASVVLYRDKSIRRHQVFACGETTTYALVNTTIMSSKSGGPAASSWATLQSMGEAGYQDMIRKLMDSTWKLVDGINAIDGVRVVGKPDMCMFCFTTTDGLNIFQLQMEIIKRGWYAQPQLGAEESPAALHISVVPRVVGGEEEFLKVLQESVDALRAREDKIDLEMIRQQVQGMLAGLTPEQAKDALVQMAGLDGDEGLPDDFSLINSVLDALPYDLRRFLLEDYINEVFA